MAENNDLIKGKTIYLVMYNYSDHDYSVVSALSSLDDAYKYVCEQEYCEFIYEKFKLITLQNLSDLTTNFEDGYIHVCYIPLNYLRFNLSEYVAMSSYIIVPMIVS